MSIYSDVYISEEKAREIVTKVLLSQQEILVKQAVKGMDKWELSDYINDDNSCYYYRIERDDKEEEE